MNRKKVRNRCWGNALALSLLLTSLPVSPIQATTVTLPQEEAKQQTDESEAFTLHSSISSTWNTEDELRVYAKSVNGNAIDQTSYQIVGGSDRYEIVNGNVQLKKGAKAIDGETITIEASADYYLADELLYADDLESEGSFIPSAEGKYCLTHSSSASHNGLLAGTTSHTNVKDGMWSGNIQSQGRLVFWYYDPCTEEERDVEALASRSSFDQMKFGMVINNYTDLLVGVGIPASGDLGPAGTTMSLSERLSYSESYVVRYNSRWNKTNITRSEGWHKIEADVSEQGTTLWIDGTSVCLAGSDEALVIPGVTSITKTAVATNWGDKNEVVEFMEDKHFIDDIYVLKPGVDQPHQQTQTISVTVELPDDTEDWNECMEAKQNIEDAKWQAISMDSAASLEAVEAFVQSKAEAIANGLTTVIEKISWNAPVAGTKEEPEGIDGLYRFRVRLEKNNAIVRTAILKQQISASPYVQKEMEIVFNEDNSGSLIKGESGRLYLENAQDVAVDSIVWSADNPGVQVDVDGTIFLKPGYTPKAGETVTVQALVNYWDDADVIFADSFEGEKKFTTSADSYALSQAGSLFGRQAATASSVNGYPQANFDSVSDVTVTAWYYDGNGGADQTKFGFSINGTGTALGVFYDGVIAPYVNNETKTHYGARIPSGVYNNYAWGTTDAGRWTGWHKFQWIVDSETGLTEMIDGQVISTNSIVGATGTDHNLIPVENIASVTSVNSVAIMDGWSNNATNFNEIKDRYFIDGVTVVSNDAAIQTKQLTSVEIPVSDLEWKVSPSSFESDQDYPNGQTFLISPYLEGDTEIVSAYIDENELPANVWEVEYRTAPENALNYPASLEGYTFTLQAEGLLNLSQGHHVLSLVTLSGSEIPIEFEVRPAAHVAQSYYVSNTGSDDNDGLSEQSPWKTLDKLQSVTFGPGDHIYLDATSTWSGVQFRPAGSGSDLAPVVLGKYNDGGDESLRPILNGDGTVADLDAHSYLAFDAWRAFYPSGTIELINVDNWEIHGVEITNYEQEMRIGATGRNGIAVIHDYLETQGYTSLPSTTVALEQAFYEAGKLRHIVIDDCYIHDVVGYHPANGAVGRGQKMSGGINIYGPYDDLTIENNIVMYCDVEGIRNDVLAWMGDTRTQFPAYMKNVSVSNNYIAGVPGDGVVISSADQPVIENNYLTDAGYSYYATSASSNVSGITWNASNLASCKNVSQKTGGTVKEMGNRNSPITMGATNFAGLWFIGTKDAVAQYNEAVNNVWTCNDGEAFDADMFCKGTIFQYNYTYRNNGGFALFMPTMDEGTVVRYNVSVEDGASKGVAESQNGLFHYLGVPEAIHNNVFILADSLNTVFGGSANTAWFYNNIMIAPNGLSTTGTFGGFHMNGSSDGAVSNPALAGEMKNNLFYPSEIVDSIVDGSSVVLEDNIVLESEEQLKDTFIDLDGFMSNQPVQALKGRSAFTGQSVDNLELGKGAGVAMDVESGRSVQTPSGGFDLDVFTGLRLSASSVARNTGRAQLREYAYKATNDEKWPLTEDFLEQELSHTITNIGIDQSEEATVIQPEITGVRILLSMAVDYASDLEETADWTHVNALVKAFFDASLANGKAVLLDADADDDTVIQAWLSLTKAIQMCQFTSNKEELRWLIAQAQALDLDLYEDGQEKEDFLAALESAVETETDPAALDEVSIAQAVETLRNAMNALIEKQPVALDTSLLEWLMHAVADQLDQASLYEESGWNTFEQAYSHAQSVLDNPQTQEEIDDAAYQLHQAWIELRLKPDEELLALLMDLVDQIQALDTTLYSQEELGVLNAFVQSVQDVISNKDLLNTQKESLTEDALKVMELLERKSSSKISHADETALSISPVVKSQTTNTAAQWLPEFGFTLAAFAGASVLLLKRRRAK